MSRTIISGRDIFPVGSVQQTPHGPVRILWKRIKHDHTVYEVEQLDSKILTPYQPPQHGIFPYLRQAWEKLRVVLH